VRYGYDLALAHVTGAGLKAHQPESSSGIFSKTGIQLDIVNSRLPFGTADGQGRRTIQSITSRAGIAHAAYSRLGGPHAASRWTGRALYWLFVWRRSRHDGHSSVANRLLAEHHDMVKAVPPDRTDQPLRISHIELMPKNKDFSPQRRARPEQADQRAPDQPANTAHQAQVSADSRSPVSRFWLSAGTGRHLVALPSTS
jgi:hypothetical protein